VAQAVADAGDRLALRDPQAVCTLLARTPQRLGNRQWFARLLPVPAWHYWAWWGTTLPLRLLLGRHI
jgi:hypothetical protein